MKIPDDFYRAVLIPAAQALITGVLAFCAGLAVCALGGWPWYYAAIGAGLVSLLAWLRFWGWWSLVILDVLTPDRVQLIDDPEPQAEPQTVKVIIQEHQGQDTQIIDLPATGDQLRALASGLDQGQSFNLGTWAGPGAPFTRSEFEQLRAELLRRGLLRCNTPGTPQRGYALTLPGVHVMRRLANPPTPPQQ